MKQNLKKEYLQWKAVKFLKTAGAVSAFLLCMFLLTQPQESHGYEIYQGPPAGKFSDTTVLVTPNGSSIAAANPLTTQTQYGSITSLRDHYGIDQYIAPNGEIVAVPLYKLVGDSFSGTTIDTNFWGVSTGTGGSTSIGGGELTISTGTTANNAVEVTSNHIARFSGLAPNKIRTVVQLPDTGVANNVRHWGMWTATDGATFEMAGTTFQLTTRKGGVDSVITNGNFNGQYGATFTPGTVSHFYEIIYQPRQVVWLADNKIIHTLNANQTPWSGTLHLPIHYGNVNSGGSTTNVAMKVRLGTIARFGIPETQEDGYFQQGLTAGVLIKNSPGNVRSLALSGVTNNSVVTLYDGLSTAGSVIFSTGTMGAQTAPFSIDLGNEAFNVGLFLTITGAAANAKVTFD